MVAEGKPIKAIAAARRVPAQAVDAEVEAVFVKLAEGVSAGSQSALRRLRMLHQAIVDREEQGETLSRLLPSGLAEKLRRERRAIGETERVVVTVLMSDIRSYSAIAEHADPSQLAGQLNTHRAAMNQAILGQLGTVMQFVGDAVMAVFGAPFPQPWTCTPCMPISTGGGRPTACHLSGSAWACRPARRRPRCSGRPNGWNTRWWETPSTCPSACSNWPTAERLCCLRPRSRRCAPRWRRPPSARSGSRGETLWCTPTRSTGWGNDERDPSRAGRARGAQDLRGRERAGPGAAGGEPDHRGGRLRRPDGPVGLRQVHAAEPGGRAGHAGRGGDRGRGRAGDRAERG